MLKQVRQIWDVGWSGQIPLHANDLNCEDFVQAIFNGRHGGIPMINFLLTLCNDEEGQDIAEYAVMLAVILVLVVGTIRLVGTNANNVFSTVASSVQ